jgi:hypothetical protein
MVRPRPAPQASDALSGLVNIDLPLPLLQHLNNLLWGSPCHAKDTSLHKNQANPSGLSAPSSTLPSSASALTIFHTSDHVINGACTQIFCGSVCNAYKLRVRAQFRALRCAMCQGLVPVNSKTQSRFHAATSCSHPTIVRFRPRILTSAKRLKTSTWCLEPARYASRMLLNKSG